MDWSSIVLGGVGDGVLLALAAINLQGIFNATPVAPPPMPPPSPLGGPSSNPAVGSTGAPGGDPNAEAALREPPTTAPPPPPPPLLPPPPPSPAPAPGGPPSSTPSLPPGQVKKPPVAPVVPDVGGQQAPKVPPPSEAPPPPSESPPPPPPEGPNASKDAESGSVPSALGLSESRLPGVPAAGENSRSRAPAAPTASGASGGEKTAKAPPAGAHGGKRLETDWTTPSALSFEPGGLMPPPPPAPGTTRPGESSGSSGTPEAGGPLSPWRLNALNLLSASHRHLPAASDGRRNRRYVPRNPYVHVDTRGNAAYPMQPTRNYEDPAMFEKYDLDTLFFIFYYQQGSYQQHLAAKELKKLSWRYHTKYLTWFQRHEEPRMTASDFERGAYVYFDHDSGWCQRIKSDFTFEYAYLEDEPM